MQKAWLYKTLDNPGEAQSSNTEQVQKNHEIDGKFRMNHVCSMYINVPICTMGKYLMFIDVHGC